MTGLGRQSKTLSDAQLKRLLAFVKTETRFPERNTAIVQLSFRAGLRAKEIACLTWEMCVDEGIVGGKDCELELRNIASKGNRGGRRIPMNENLRVALDELYTHEKEKDDDERGTATAFVVTLARATSVKARASAVSFLMNGNRRQQGWYAKLGFTGVTSHAGRRTFITKAARMVSSVGGSLKDVMEISGHSSLQMTARYTDENAEAKRKLVNRM